MINKNDFDGGLVYGPNTFAEITGRNKVWAASPGAIASAHRPCPNCGRDERKLLWHTPSRSGLVGWDYSRCPCGMVYTVEAPKPEELDRVYKSAPAQQEWVRLQQNEVELRLDRLKFQWALEKAGWPLGNRAILDIGCSTGTLLEVARSLSPTCAAWGVEVNREAARVAMGRISPLQVNEDLDGYDSEMMDVVVLWEVLEHVLDPRAMLKRAWELLAPGGKLVICVPNMASLAVSILHEHCPCFGLGHINMWTPGTLNDLLVSTLGEIGPGAVDFDTIISWRHEIANWMGLHGPMDRDTKAFWLDYLIPSADTIHENLAGYKLVAFVEKG